MPGQSFRGFSERVALVTGGAYGISRAIALQLAYEGAYVIVVSPPGDAGGTNVVKELCEIGTLAHSLAADVSRAADVARLFAELDGLYGRLDLLVNSASFNTAAPLAEFTEEMWDETLSVNLKSAFLCAQASVRLMLGRPKAAIVNLAAETSLSPNAGHSAGYVAAQAGIRGLTEALAQELAPRVRVNCVSVRGRNKHQSSQTDELQPQPSVFEAAGLATFEAPAPDEVARACIYLLSSDAAAITGQTLIVGS